MSSLVYIIAELSANHNNNYDLAQETILAMKKAGANAIKFQTFTADSLSMDIDNEYFGPLKEGLWKGKKPYQLFTEAAMPWDWQKPLSEFAISLGLDWLSTPFDYTAVDYLENINIPVYKIASMEITDIPLIKYIASKQKPIIISTGVATEEDIELAITSCKEEGNDQITLLKCTSQYPAPIDAANLNTIKDMQERFGLEVGLSDHSFGSIVPVVAVSLGATMIEKHFILDRSIGGPDSGFSMEPAEFKQMVDDVRNAEKALGKINYEVPEKDKLRRRSLFAVKNIKKGEILTMENIRSLRPGYGLHPKYLNEIMGKKAQVDIPKGTALSFDHLD